jgi:O-antigen ligase
MTMSAISTPAGSARLGARQGAPRLGGLAVVLGIAGLALLGALMGYGLVLGELDAFFISLTVIACIAVLSDFRIGAVLLILMLPVESSNLFPHSIFGITGLNPINLVLAATLASCLLHGRRQAAGKFVPRPLLWLYVVPLAAAGILGSQHAQDVAPILYELEVIHFLDAPGYLRDIVVKPLTMVLVALLLAAAVARSQKPERYLLPIGAAIWVMCLLSLAAVLRTSVTVADLASPDARTFFSGLGMHANDLGRLYAIAYALLLFAWAESKNRLFRFACVATMGVVVTALVFTFSRGAFLGFVIVNALFLLWRFNAKTAAIALLAAVALMLVLPGEVFERVSMGFASGDVNEVSAGRIDGIWTPLLPELWRSPIWGNGLGSVMWSDAMRHGQMFEVTHPHSAYIEAILDVGVVGLCLLIAYFLQVWKGFRSLGSNAFLTPEMRGFYQGAAAGLLSFFVTGFAGSSFAPRAEYAFLWLAIGMMYGQLARRPAG